MGITRGRLVRDRVGTVVSGGGGDVVNMCATLRSVTWTRRLRTTGWRPSVCVRAKAREIPERSERERERERKREKREMEIRSAQQSVGLSSST